MIYERKLILILCDVISSSNETRSYQTLSLGWVIRKCIYGNRFIYFFAVGGTLMSKTK